jgi:hypothetical protein
MSYHQIIESFSIYSVVLPLLAGLPFYLKLPPILKAFVIFLLIGWMVDIGSNDFPSNRVYNFYALLESCFFLCFLFFQLKGKTNSFWLLFWVLCYAAFFAIYHLYFLHDPTFTKADSVFTSSIKIINAFLAAGTIFTLGDRGESFYRSANLWFTTGIFFYCFGTYFIFSFLDSDLYQSLWWIHNSINIITNLIFAFAFLVWAQKIKGFNKIIASKKP